MIVVADASPLIFLGKLEQLELLNELFPSPILVPTLVRDEILAPPLPPDQRLALERFLEGVSIEEPTQKPAVPGLSRADNAVLGLALAKRADRLLADDRILRRVAQVEGLRPLGTLGILLRATRIGLLEARDTRRLLRDLLHEHGLRLGIEVWDAVQRELSDLPESLDPER